MYTQCICVCGYGSTVSVRVYCLAWEFMYYMINSKKERERERDHITFKYFLNNGLDYLFFQRLRKAVDKNTCCLVNYVESGNIVGGHSLFLWYIVRLHTAHYLNYINELDKNIQMKFLNA